MTPILDLYHCSELLQRSCQQLELAGNTQGAAHCREAAVQVFQAIAAAVRERAESNNAQEITS